MFDYVNHNFSFRWQWSRGQFFRENELEMIIFSEFVDPSLFSQYTIYD